MQPEIALLYKMGKNGLNVLPEIFICDTLDFQNERSILTKRPMRVITKRLIKINYLYDIN